MVNNYFSEFVKKHGGDNVFSERIGITRQAVGNIKRGANRATEKVLLAIEESFSDFDRMMYFRGDREVIQEGKKKLFIKIEEFNPLFLKAIDMIDEHKQTIADSIGKTTMIFSKIKNLESIPATETLGALRILYKLNINALIDNDEDNLFAGRNLAKELAEARKEAEEAKEETIFYKKIIEQLLNKR